MSVFDRKYVDAAGDLTEARRIKKKEADEFIKYLKKRYAKDEVIKNLRKSLSHRNSKGSRHIQIYRILREKIGTKEDLILSKDGFFFLNETDDTQWLIRSGFINEMSLKDRKKAFEEAIIGFIDTEPEIVYRGVRLRHAMCLTGEAIGFLFLFPVWVTVCTYDEIRACYHS